MQFTLDTTSDPLCLGNIRACAAASAFVYDEVSWTDISTGKGVLIQDCGNAVMIAFPGTHNIRDVLTDLDFVRRKVKILGQSCEVHKGFDHVHEATIGKVASLLAPLAAKPLFIGGHSEGAALAKRCALALLELNQGIKVPFKVQGVITFGEPRGGNSAYAAIYNSVLAQRTIRITNASDPVPWVPGWMVGNRHCGPEGYMPPNNSRLVCGPSLWLEVFDNAPEIIREFRSPQLTVASDHHIANYARRVNELN